MTIVCCGGGGGHDKVLDDNLVGTGSATKNKKKYIRKRNAGNECTSCKEEEVKQ